MNITVQSGNFLRQLSDLGAGLYNNMAQAVRVATDAGYLDAKNTTLFKDQSGELRESIGESVDGLKGKIFRGRKKYFGFVANGTTAHIIQAGAGGVLAFRVNGQMTFRRSVRHPGTEARPFMQHAYDVAAQTFESVADRFVDAAIRRFNQ